MRVSLEIAEPTSIDAIASNKKRLQEIEDQANPLIQMEKFFKMKD